MTNYERICTDKEFCAFAVMDECLVTFDEAMAWLGTEQREVTEQEDA